MCLPGRRTPPSLLSCLSSCRISVFQSLSAAGHLSAIYWFQKLSLLQSSWLQRVYSVWPQLDTYENHPPLKAHLLMHPINTTLKTTLILAKWHKPLISAFRTQRQNSNIVSSGPVRATWWAYLRGKNRGGDDYYPVCFKKRNAGLTFHSTK